MKTLKSDPYNLIITGVGGQGNVLASRILGGMLSTEGYYITIGETFGASQRGGSVMSHIRISTKNGYSPQIAKGQAHMIVSLEPTETIRVLRAYGNHAVKAITNTRPVYSAGVIAGELSYPEAEDIRIWIGELTESAWFVDATDEAMRVLNDPIFSNIILLGVLTKTGELPLSRDLFERTVAESVKADKIDQNLEAFDLGMTLI